MRKSWLPSRDCGLTEARAAVLAVEVGPGKGGTGLALVVLRPGCGLTGPYKGSPCALLTPLQPALRNAKPMKPSAINAAVGKRGEGFGATWGKGSVPRWVAASRLLDLAIRALSPWRYSASFSAGLAHLDLLPQPGKLRLSLVCFMQKQAASL